MAGFRDSSTHLAPSASSAPLLRPAPPPSRRSLPNGPCNYRDASVGHCGCDQFWDKLSADLHDESAEQSARSERSTWCVCGHHACFHLRASRASERRAPSISAPLPSTNVLCEGQCDAKTGLRQPLLSRDQPGMRHESLNLHYSHSLPSLRQTTQLSELGRIAQSQDTPSQASTSGLPGIPSVCLLSHERRPVTNSENRHGVNQSHHTVAGLGLSSMQLDSTGHINRHQSPTPTIPDDINIARTPQTNQNRSDRSFAGANPAYKSMDASSPSRGILEQILPFNRNIELDIPGDTIPNTYNPEDCVQSATEVATPSVGNTPDLSVADQAVQDGKNLIDALAKVTADMQQQAASPSDRPTYATVPTQLLLENTSSVTQEQLQNLLQTASPQGLQKLVSYLAPLHNLLNSIPNVANTMRDLGSRLDMLENGSFNYVQPEDLNQTLEMYEGRLIEVEHRMDEHDKLHQNIDEHGSSCSFTRRRIENVNTSFESNHSANSTTSSALILAAMDRKNTEMELDHIKQRLDVLEAAAPPTSLAPWEIEVVLLPWGPDLQGIWFLPEESMHDADKTTTQNSEEWTQARSSRASTITSISEARRRDTDSSPYPGAPTMGNDSVLHQHESGWSSQDISNWAAGSTGDWLFPKACGSNNLVYKRLQSRGFVRDITLKGASAKDVQETLSNAFSDVLDHLQYDDSDENPMIATYPGLRASYIPLRKVLRDSRLRFLTPAEMSSSAFWTAQFLASGVMMRVSGGKKRLYVTHREAYTQQVDRNEFVVMEQSWPELRQLPRYQPDKDSQMEGNDENCRSHVPEADAKEACWQFVEAYDAPPASVHSSFGSNQSVQLSMRPASREWQRSITPNSILKNKQTHPISPLSENPPRRPSFYRNRTVSASIMDTFPPSSAKRRLDASSLKQSSASQTILRTPSLMSRLKRRRVTDSSSPRPNEEARAEPQVPIWNATPRRSREPPSPYCSSQPALPRSYSDIASRPSQRSAMTGKSTPFAYATPHSGPFMGAGFDAYNNGGDTEPDDDNNAYDDDDDGEQSWRGVTDGESVSSSVANAAIGVQEGASFSGDDSGFGSENDDDSDAQSNDAEDYAQRHQGDEDEDEDDIFDSLLSVIQD
ncbi:hypothetical protein yc1106_02528 [Curvularia clavata]|uniref:Uncharacterized protein n=1 Tax=Curvularia clavata TaxID=95742 RepID=A0A9Q8Z3E3_CURCL|nr:hypothetical protein yc1106_02528 [Curvularia clavata]